MVESGLTKERIEAGKALLVELEKKGVQPDAAFWLYNPEVADWKLVLAEVKVPKTGPRDVYRQVQKIIDQLPSEWQESISLDLVALTSPDAPLVRLLRKAIRTGPGITGIRFTNNVIDGVIVEDAYIYRVM
jgi:hypothetical protein